MGPKFYENYDLLIRAACPEYDECMNLILDYLPQNAVSVLDLGCGNGNLLKKIIKKNPEIMAYGVELRAQLVNLAERKLKKSDSSNVKIIQGDILDFEWPKAQVVVSSLAIHHFSHDQKREVFKKIYEDADVFLYFDRVKGRSASEEKKNLEYVINSLRKDEIPEEIIQNGKDEMEKNDKPLTLKEHEKIFDDIGFEHSRLYFDNGFVVYYCTKNE